MKSQREKQPPPPNPVGAAGVRSPPSPLPAAGPHPAGGVGRGLVLGAAGDRAGSGGRCSGGREGSAPRAAAQNETRCTLERDLLIWPRRSFRAALKENNHNINDGEKSLSHEEHGAGCGAGASGSAGTGWGNRGAGARQRRLLHALVGLERGKQNTKPPRTHSSSPLPPLLLVFFFFNSHLVYLISTRNCTSLCSGFGSTKNSDKSRLGSLSAPVPDTPKQHPRQAQGDPAGTHCRVPPRWDAQRAFSPVRSSRLCSKSLASAGWVFIFFFFFFFSVCVFLSLPDASLSTPEQRYLFDISSLPEAEEVTGAELRVLRALPENRSLALSPEGTFHHLLLSTCPSRDGEEPRLLDSRAADVLDAGSSRWEVFDVWEALRGRRERSPSGKLLCFLLRIVSDQSGRLLPPRQLGFSKPRPQPHERALLVAFSRTQRKENLFKEIRDKIKALGVSLRGGVRLPPALPPGAHQPRHHPDPDELHGPGVHPPELLCALQAQPHQHPLHRLREQRGQAPPHLPLAPVLQRAPSLPASPPSPEGARIHQKRDF
uniref:TGF-beta propeptide domain-containing protein n=1 Tax=Anser cygnoides TaxID=8845 RepID=A0A8B9DGL0_ANSCY